MWLITNSGDLRREMGQITRRIMLDLTKPTYDKHHSTSTARPLFVQTRTILFYFHIKWQFPEFFSNGPSEKFVLLLLYVFLRNIRSDFQREESLPSYSNLVGVSNLETYKVNTSHRFCNTSWRPASKLLFQQDKCSSSTKDIKNFVVFIFNIRTFGLQEKITQTSQFLKVWSEQFFYNLNTFD